MTHLQAIESELGLCMDELRMLQSSANPNIHYKFVLDGLQLKLIEITKLMPRDTEIKIAFIGIVYIIVQAVYLAKTEVWSLDIQNHEHWERTYNVFEILHKTFVALQFGSELIHKKFENICDALAKGTAIRNKKRFLSMSVSRNSTMLEIMSKVGKLLSEVKNGDDDFYGFLGPEAKNKMEEIILFLIRRQ